MWCSHPDYGPLAVVFYVTLSTCTLGQDKLKYILDSLKLKKNISTFYSTTSKPMKLC